jgi:hypothetical protein
MRGSNGCLGDTPLFEEGLRRVRSKALLRLVHSTTAKASIRLRRGGDTEQPTAVRGPGALQCRSRNERFSGLGRSIRSSGSDASAMMRPALDALCDAADKAPGTSIPLLGLLTGAMRDPGQARTVLARLDAEGHIRSDTAGWLWGWVTARGHAFSARRPSTPESVPRRGGGSEWLGEGASESGGNPVAFHVYRHTGDPEGGLVEDAALQSESGFSTFEDACEATKRLFPDDHLVMLAGPYSGEIVSIRRPGASEWPPRRR